MRIAHVSDIHIRNLRYHDEYRRVFEDLYAKLRELKPDLIINTGDTAHTKVQISPEFVEMTSEHIRHMAHIAPYHIILGNHDLNLMNRERQDAISPIVDSLRSGPEPLPVFLHKKSGRVTLADPMLYDFDEVVNLWVFGMADSENFPRPSHWAEFPDDVNIGLFHGAVSTCVTDTNWRMTHTEYDLSLFDGLDYVLMGDIHKQQFFNDRRIAYAGSLIQQNFGEDVDKGFLLWDINGKRGHQVQHIPLQGSRKFFTLKLNNDLSFPELTVDEGSRLRISPPREITLAEQKEVEKLARQKYQPHDIITLAPTNIGSQRASVGGEKIQIENLRQVAVQERLLRDYLSERSVPERIVERVLDLNRKYQITIDQSEEVVRNISWRLNKLSWSNLFNYGEGNLVDFDSLGGLTGIFAPNASGKSNLIDVILETCFDSTTRGISKNIHLINDNKEQATMVADVTANGQNYVIERTIERLKYGQKRFTEAKEWGKTSVNFAVVDELGDQQSALVGTLRPETEKNIRQRLGTYEDMLLTALAAQWNPLDIISCKETERKKILYRFLDLDVFDEKYKMARDEGKQHRKRLTEMEDSNLEEIVSTLQSSVDAKRQEIAEAREDLESTIAGDKLLESRIVELTSQKVKIDGDLDERSATAELKDVRDRRDVLSNKLNGLQMRLTAAEGELTKIVRLEERFDLETAQEKERRLSHLNSEIELRQRMMKESGADVKSYRKSLKLLEEVPCGDQFPQCQFLIDAFRAKEKLPTVEGNVSRWKSEIDEMSLELPDLTKVKEKLDLYRKFVSEKSTREATVTQLSLEVENVQLKISSLNEQESRAQARLERIRQAYEDIETNVKLDKQISLDKNQRVALESRIRVIREDLDLLTKKLGGDESVLEKVRSQLDDLAELRDVCTAYEHYGYAMGKDGIAYRIMTQKLPLINEEINKILGSSAEFGVVIEHDHEEQSIRIYIQYGEYKMRLIELGSGAEKMLASLAIRSALLSISSLPKPNMFIVDEGFGKLDSRNIEAVQKIFDYLKSAFQHVLVISHVDNMKDMVDNIIEISTDSEGYAHIEVGG